jgi:hypothetical protein
MERLADGHFVRYVLEQSLLGCVHGTPRDEVGGPGGPIPSGPRDARLARLIEEIARPVELAADLVDLAVERQTTRPVGELRYPLDELAVWARMGRVRASHVAEGDGEEQPRHGRGVRPDCNGGNAVPDAVGRDQVGQDDGEGRDPGHARADQPHRSCVRVAEEGVEDDGEADQQRHRGDRALGKPPLRGSEAREQTVEGRGAKHDANCKKDDRSESGQPCQRSARGFRDVPERKRGCIHRGHLGHAGLVSARRRVSLDRGHLGSVSGRDPVLGSEGAPQATSRSRPVSTS